jgi:ketosteroid isomerase-like protein
MANKKPAHVTPRDDGWAVIREGSSRATSVHRTQQEAAAAGKAAAQRDKTEFLLHGRNGQIRSRNSYGNDPNPPRG